MSDTIKSGKSRVAGLKDTHQRLNFALKVQLSHEQRRRIRCAYSQTCILPFHAAISLPDGVNHSSVAGLKEIS
jgi:hypothetical protein